jgi:2-iminobutanoate/2-iminopropanoate deaminase
MRWMDHLTIGWRGLLPVLGLVILLGCAPEAKVEEVETGPPPHQAISAASAPAAIGPYSQGVQVGNTLYCAGQIGMDPASGALVEGGIEAQTKQALDNLGAVLSEAGMNYDNVVRSTVFLDNIDDFQAMNGIYKEYFKSDHPPARSTVQVAKIPRGALVEIDFIAVK